MGTHFIPGRAGPGFLERHRVVAALSALLLATLVGALLGAGAAVVLTEIVTMATNAFTGGR
jgi:hypothetical protein